MTSTARLRFPPLASVVGLENAPPPVDRLLRGRWMAEPASEEHDPTFVVEWQVAEGAGAAGGEPAYAVHWQPGEELGQLRNDTGRVLLSPTTDRSRIEIEPDFETRAAGLESLLEAALGHALAARGECFLHAAAFELGGRCPLVIGHSGAGKSTLTAAAVGGGGRAISDDSLLLGLLESRPVVRTARRDLWLRPGSRALLPALERQGLAAEPVEDGRIRLSRASRDDAFLTSARPDCLVLLSGSGDTSDGAARSLHQSEALAALLQGTSALYVTDERFADRQCRLLELLTAFAEELPAIELGVGSSLLSATAESLAAIVDALP